MVKLKCILCDSPMSYHSIMALRLNYISEWNEDNKREVINLSINTCGKCGNKIVEHLKLILNKKILNIEIQTKNGI